ncbi:MAG: YIP1 family protein [Candidatus Promineifilaceae bacterium]|nr:YIP1 family protein [Candidatus Promineifilaceae bacterium]
MNESPFLPRHLIQLFVQPVRFFTGHPDLEKRANLVLAMWIVGIARVADEITELADRAELGLPRPGWDQVGPIVTESWLGFWATALVAGVVSGLFLYWIGGWWFKVRLRFAGASDPAAKRARVAYAYSSFVYAGAAVLLLLGETLLYVDFAAARSNSVIGLILFPVFTIWSYVIGYKAAITLFDLSLWKARFWFFILPLLVIVVGYMLLVVAMLLGP